MWPEHFQRVETAVFLGEWVGEVTCSCNHGTGRVRGAGGAGVLVQLVVLVSGGAHVRCIAFTSTLVSSRGLPCRLLSLLLVLVVVVVVVVCRLAVVTATVYSCC